MRLLITQGSDIESYFTRPAHVAEVMASDPAEAQALVENVLHEDMIEFVTAFINKRGEIKRTLYKKDPEACPDVNALINGHQIPVEKAVGKLLLKRVKQRLQAGGFNGGNIVRLTGALADPDIAALFA